MYLKIILKTSLDRIYVWVMKLVLFEFNKWKSVICKLKLLSSYIRSSMRK